jgi:hypothetical protein
MSTLQNSGILYNDGFQVNGSGDHVVYNYPIRIVGNVTVSFGENLIFSEANKYFIISNNTDNVTIDGKDYTVTIDGVTAGYNGLIQSKSNNTKVKNIGVLSTNNSKLTEGAGWLGQGGTAEAGGFLGTVTNCYSGGNIGNIGEVNDGCGGLIGALAGSGGSCTITNCYTSGDILNNSCGGIVGIDSGYKTGNVGYCEVNSCYTTGDITGNQSGGIVGRNAGIAGECKVINCYSIGTIGGINAGGIVGKNAGVASNFVIGKCNIINCFSTGVISGGGAGGITGSEAGHTSGTTGYCKVDGCYSTGNISGAYSGGITGRISAASGLEPPPTYLGTCIINNCYSTGIISGINDLVEYPQVSIAGGILGPNNIGAGGGIITITNCYVSGNITNGNIGGIVGGASGATVTNCNYNDGWTDATASSTTSGVTKGLLNPTTGSIWKKIILDVPWKLNAFLNGATAVYNPMTKYLSYTSLFPINTIKGLVLPIVLLVLPFTSVGSVIDNHTKSVSYPTREQPILENMELRVLLSSNSVTRDWINSLLITLPTTPTTTTTTTSTTSTTTTTSTTSTTTTTTTTLPPTELHVNQNYVKNTSFPVKVGGGTKAIPFKIILDEDITITSRFDQIRFIITDPSSYVIFDGEGHTIQFIFEEYSFFPLDRYEGLITSASDNTIVKNVGILYEQTYRAYRDGIITFTGYTTNNIILDNGAGWIGSNNFIGTIDTCYSTGVIGTNCGGIVGANSGTGGTCTITNCYSTGYIYGSESGGIAGYGAGSGSERDSTGKCIIRNCYSTGSGGGSITGSFAGTYWVSSPVDFSKVGKFLCSISGCYSTGNVVSIVGDNSGLVISSQTSTATNYISSALSIDNCFITNKNSRLTGSNSRLGTSTNNYIIGGWDDTIAEKTLDKKAFLKVSPNGINRPWKLVAFLYTAVPNLNKKVFYYYNIWRFPPVPEVKNAVLVGVNGNRVSTGEVKYDYIKGILTIYGVNISSTMSYYSLVINEEYIDRFLLVGNLVVRIRFTADYYQVISTPAYYEEFKLEVRRAIADVLGIGEIKVTVVNLSPGSIVAEVDIPPELIDQLQSSVKSGNLSVEFDGTKYPADPKYFEIIDNTCFHKDTLILTPSGYRKVQDLSRGDLVKTAQGREVPVIRISSFIGSREKCPLYVMYKDTLAPNVPLQDLYMSEGHAFYNNGQWRHMKCSELTTKLELDNMPYYNIVLDNYTEHTLVANGVEVESLFDMKGLKMHWRCEEKCCKPVIESSN